MVTHSNEEENLASTLKIIADIRTEAFVNLRESQDNMRPPSRPATSTGVRKSKPMHPTSTLLPRPRLRLEEAWDNADRNRRTCVFSVNPNDVGRLKWKKKAPELDEDSDALKDSMTSLLTMNKSLRQEPLIWRRGPNNTEADGNRSRAHGNLSLTGLSVKDDMKNTSETNHLRCAGDEAIQNQLLGHKGSGIDCLIQQKPSMERPRTTGSQGRAVSTDEARANWLRDRVKEQGQMHAVLDNNWTKQQADKDGNNPNSRHTKIRLASGNTDPPDNTGSQMAAIMGQPITSAKPEAIQARSIPQPGAPNASREGAAMAERFGVASRSVGRFNQSDEVNDSIQQAIRSRDMVTTVGRPKAKFEGLEYALRGRGTLTMGNCHATPPEEMTKAVPRVRPEAAEIAAANQGQGVQTLLSKDRLGTGEGPIRPSRRSNRPRDFAAASCINPRRPKWKGTVRYKRRPVPKMHATF